jgi:hypothetical protein
MNIQFTPSVPQKIRLPTASYLSNVQPEPVNRQLFLELLIKRIPGSNIPPGLIRGPQLLKVIDLISLFIVSVSSVPCSQEECEALWLLV